MPVVCLHVDYGIERLQNCIDYSLTINNLLTTSSGFYCPVFRLPFQRLKVGCILNPNKLQQMCSACS